MLVWIVFMKRVCTFLAIDLIAFPVVKNNIVIEDKFQPAMQANKFKGNISYSIHNYFLMLLMVYRTKN